MTATSSTSPAATTPITVVICMSSLSEIKYYQSQSQINKSAWAYYSRETNVALGELRRGYV